MHTRPRILCRDTKIILIDKLRDAEQVKFISEARDEPNCGQTVCYRQGAKPGQTDK